MRLSPSGVNIYYKVILKKGDILKVQEMMAKAYGFESAFALNHTMKDKNGKVVSAFKIAKKDEPFLFIAEDNDEPCAMCGNIHPVGYKSKNGAKHLLRSMISDTYNECYSLSVDNFICEFCAYCMVSYGSADKNPFGRKMLSSVVHHDGKYEDKYFNSDKDNELYRILKNPPKPPFVILINSRGTVLENLTFTAKPTLAEEWIVVNYGLENLSVNPDEVFECIEDAREISQKAKIEISSDHIWNRQNDVSISPSQKLKLNELFFQEMGIFLAKYDRATRVVGKMILAAYLQEFKKAPTRVEVEASKTEQKTLFDF